MDVSPDNVCGEIFLEAYAETLSKGDLKPKEMGGNKGPVRFENNKTEEVQKIGKLPACLGKRQPM